MAFTFPALGSPGSRYQTRENLVTNVNDAIQTAVTNPVDVANVQPAITALVGNGTSGPYTLVAPAGNDPGMSRVKVFGLEVPTSEYTIVGDQLSFDYDIAVGAEIEVVSFGSAYLSAAVLGGIPVATSILSLKALPTGIGAQVRLLTPTRDSFLEWDGTVPAATHQADVGEIIFIAPNPSANGAWVDTLADSRKGFWTNSANPARFLRVRSGIRGGESVQHRGETGADTATGSWLQGIGLNAGNDPAATWGYMEHNASVCFTRTTQVTGTFANRLTGAQDTSSIGLIAAAYNDSSSSDGKAWAAYLEGGLGLSGRGRARAFEANAFNLGTPNPTFESPYSDIPTPHAFVAGFAAGGDANVHGPSFPIQSFIRFNNNGAQAMTGLLFRSNSLQRESTGAADQFAKAITLARNQGFVWYSNEDQAEAGRFTFNLSSQAFGQNLSITDAGLNHRTRAGAQLFQVPFVANAINSLEAVASVGTTPRIRVAGASANIDMYVETRGTGLFGVSYQANAYSGFAVGQVNRVIRVKDGTGATFELFARLVT